MSKCLRCGAGNEWLEGDVPVEPRAKPDPIRLIIYNRISEFLKYPDSGRWAPVARRALGHTLKRDMDQYHKGDQRMILNYDFHTGAFAILLTQLPDADLLDMYELVCRCFAKQR